MSRGVQLSEDQTRQFWKLFSLAWLAYCACEKIRASNSIAKEKWRHEQLHAVCGVYSLKQIPRAGPQFVKIMAHLEVIARSGIFWQLRVHGADTRHLVHTIRTFCQQHDLDEDYARGIAQKALRREELPDLENLSAAQLCEFARLLHAEIAKFSECAAASTTDIPF